MPGPDIEAPAGFVPTSAISFGTLDNPATLVDAENPLPVAIRASQQPAAPAPLAATTGASGMFGPFAPELGRAIWVTLTGDWSGTVRLLRSVDGGATKLPLTLMGLALGQFAGNVQEPVGEESEAAATWYLEASLTGGALTFRVSQ